MLRLPLLTALLLTAAVAYAEDAPAKDGLIVSALDPTVPPCENFFLHACNGWIKANPIPPDQAHWGLTEALHEENQAKLRAILEQAAAHPEPQTRKIGA
jgi:putative endopeptidase